MFANGKEHDIQLFKDSRIYAKAETSVEVDTGYQRLVQMYANPLKPKKRSKNHPLSKQEGKENREILKKHLC